VLVLPVSEADAVAEAAIARQERGERNQDRVRGGEKLGDLSGATKMVQDSMETKA
jgi:4-hydroxy-4-methyl-2-oxoglutarate aldolase